MAEAMDSAQVTLVKAQAIRQLADAGYEKASVVEAVDTGDLKKLKPR